MIEDIQRVLDFWFGHIENGVPLEKNRMNLWFQGGKTMDAKISDQFGDLVLNASQGHLIDWKNTPHGRMALIILLDQFTRNIYRGTPQAFASDELAQALCLEGILIGHDTHLFLIERLFFYMPLEHSESQDLHQKMEQLYEQMAQEFPDLPPPFQGFKDSMLQHKKIIDQFGRYPHRNQILGRVSTSGEQSYLKGNHPSFGQ